jgi:hypothetical protein
LWLQFRCCGFTIPQEQRQIFALHPSFGSAGSVDRELHVWFDVELHLDHLVTAGSLAGTDPQPQLAASAALESVRAPRLKKTLI